jgi:metallophosphoesterase superfamily enzyme
LPCADAPVLACHHPQAVAGHTVIAGHMHPTLRLRGPGRDTMRTPCFGWGEGQLVLPAFGAFTGTSPTALPRSWARFAVTPGRVVAIPAGAC